MAFLVGGLAAGCASSDAGSDRPTLAAPEDLSCPGAPLDPTPMRRLTRFEYTNAVSDTLGVDLDEAILFPRDEVGLGFDDQATTLGLTDLHVEGYLKGATLVADTLAADPARVHALAGCDDDSESCARRLVSTLGRRLERRNLSDANVERLLAFFEGDFSESGFAEGAGQAVAALLQNPRFLYRIERAPAGEVASTLASPWVLSSRLSLLLWASVPDDALLEAADAGRLASASDVEREARRMLADERARRGALHFYLQWLKLSDFAEVEKDNQLFRIWNETLRSDLENETRRFLDAVLWEDDARLQTLLTAPYTFANALLSDFYGLPIGDPDQRELEKKSFGRGVPRAGLLTQGSILSVQAKANQTDPIHRGKFIREQFFCQIPEPPPPDLVVSPPRLDPRKTTRERFEQHRSDPACAGCHELLDPVGLIFEHYDAIGQYRETEADQPVDATGYLADTDVSGEVNGVLELGQRLSQSAEVRACVVKQWFRYAVGRGDTDADACTLDALGQAFAASHENLRELLVAITQTAPFLTPAPAPEPEPEP